MMRRNQKTKQAAAFTLVEIMTTLAVIAVLLALLIPALSMVEKKAKIVKQKGQFHAIGVGLEAFRSDWEDYPPSEYSVLYGIAGGNAPYTCASQRLAEALVGRDGLGFHQDSEFRARGLADVDSDGTLDPVPQAAPGIYNAVDGFISSTSTPNYYQTGPQNVAARKGPYLELETANAVMLTDIYDPANIGDLDRTYVLADVFGKKMERSGKEIGMPILYYRAHTDRVRNDPVYANWSYNTYDLNDSFCNNAGIITLRVPFERSYVQHPLAACSTDVDAARQFYSTILNPSYPGATPPPPYPRPYRANSFLLHSAGPDGLYGTVDDMFNF